MPTFRSGTDLDIMSSSGPEICSKVLAWHEWIMPTRLWMLVGRTSTDSTRFTSFDSHTDSEFNAGTCQQQ